MIKTLFSFLAVAGSVVLSFGMLHAKAHAAAPPAPGIIYYDTYDQTPTTTVFVGWGNTGLHGIPANGFNGFQIGFFLGQARADISSGTLRFFLNGWDDGGLCANADPRFAINNVDLAAFSDSGYTQMIGLWTTTPPSLASGTWQGVTFPAGSFLTIRVGCQSPPGTAAASFWGSAGTYELDPRFGNNATSYTGVPNILLTGFSSTLPPLASSSLMQFLANGSTTLREGGSSTIGTVVLAGRPLDPVPGDPVRFEVEVKPMGTSFTGIPNATSTAVVSGASASVTISDLPDGFYHWQGRAFDPVLNIASNWEEFGAPENFDLEIRSVPLPPHVLAEQTARDMNIPNPNARGAAQVFIAERSGILDALTVEDTVAYTSIGFQTPTAVAALYDSADPVLAATDNLLATSTVLMEPLREFSFDFPSHPHLIAGHTYTWIVSFASLDGPGSRSNLNGGGTNTAGGLAFANFGDSGWLHGGLLSPENYFFVVRESSTTSDPIPVPAPGPVPPPKPVPSGREPVVIVPGIMGSSLVEASSGTEVWPNITKMLLPGDHYLDDLALSTSGAERAGKQMKVGDILRDATALGVFRKDLYGGLVQSFIDRGYTEGKDLFVAPYDWRFDLATSSHMLGAIFDRARAASPNGKVNVIAHSMGALLTEAYLSGLSDASFVDKLILVGAPALGAPQAFKVLNYGDNEGIPVLSASEIKRISQNMPSAYELLPDKQYFAAAGGYVRDFRNGGAGTLLGYDATKAFLTSDPRDARNASLLALAEGFHAKADAASVGVQKIYDIIGCRMPTITEFHLFDKRTVDVRRADGDGTVPLASAMFGKDLATRYFVLGDVAGADHMGLVAASSALELIDDIAAGTLNDPTLPQGISSDPNDCSARKGKEAFLEFAARGPVALDVADASGRHTEIGGAGHEELGIPGSTLEEIGDTTLVLVPAGGTYRVRMAAIAPGESALTVRGYDGGEMDKELAFSNVRLRNNKAAAELTLKDPTEDIRLNVDANGDGVVDASYHPKTPTGTGVHLGRDHDEDKDKKTDLVHSKDDHAR